MTQARRFHYHQVKTADGWDIGFFDGNDWYFVDLGRPGTVQVLEVLEVIKMPVEEKQ